MHRFLVMAFGVMLVTGCRKAIQKAEEDALVKAVTDGRWKIANFTKGGTPITTDFAPYEFQFHKNNTVDAYKNNTFEKTGSWEGDLATRTITSNFIGATYPLEQLNGTWKIKNSTWTSVDASQTINGEIRVLKLNKL